MAARVFRERRVIAHEPEEEQAAAGEREDGRGYKGRAFLSLPICYAAPGGSTRCVGVWQLLICPLGAVQPVLGQEVLAWRRHAEIHEQPVERRSAIPAAARRSRWALRHGQRCRIGHGGRRIPVVR